MSNIEYPSPHDYPTIGAFRFWCQKVMPLVYDDSLSYYELLCKVVNQLNKTAEDLNYMGEDITTLYNFVNEYFKNLDIQNEINNKLDAMAIDGTLYNIIKKYTDPIVNDQNQKIKVLENRMDAFSQLTDGSTTGDAELEDIRVPEYGFNGNLIFSTAGNSVRGQIKELSERLTEFSDCKFIPLLSGYIDTSGSVVDTSSVVENKSWFHAVVDCEYGDTFIINVESSSSVACAYTFIDKNNNVITKINNIVATNKEITAPKNSAKLVLNSIKNGVNIKGKTIRNIKEEIKNLDAKKYIPYTCEIGKWVADDNQKIIKEDDPTRVRVKEINNMDKGVYTLIGCPGYRIVVFFTNASDIYAPSLSHNNGEEEYYFKFVVTDDLKGYNAFYMLIKNDMTNITESDIKNINNNVKILYYNSTQKTNFPYNKYGKNVNIYRYGDSGNDWCFVRTPLNYDPYRLKPYPFVICNHGNGWVMDGSEKYANWTKRTMYVPYDDPDYIKDNEQYTPTNNKELLYSNPTIEALLNAGYVVCGCENYGDNLYGNDNCRQSCANFYYHMINNYNVTDYCCMIGASNGALTCINALIILGDKIRALILQYPLTCLVNQYFSYEPHQSQIRNAYDISSVSNEEDLIEKTKTHDILHYNNINGKILNYFPPTKMYYSDTDSVVNSTKNSLALNKLLNDSLKVSEAIKVDTNGPAEHGDYRHFNPTETVEWFNKYCNN